VEIGMQRPRGVIVAVAQAAVPARASRECMSSALSRGDNRGEESERAGLRGATHSHGTCCAHTPSAKPPPFLHSNPAHSHSELPNAGGGQVQHPTGASSDPCTNHTLLQYRPIHAHADRESMGQ
jgi:hypothetical protein